jgi:hypothetical protein
VKSKSLCLAVVTMFALGTSFARAADCALTRVAALNLSERADKAGVVGYTTCISVHPLTLGRNVLSKLHIYIATKQEVMYFTAADASHTDTAT